MCTNLGDLMKKTILLGMMLVLALPLVYSLSECKPASDVGLKCTNSDCIYNMDESITVTLEVYLDNIGLAGTLVKFYMHEVGQKVNCLNDPSNYCLQRQVSGIYISNGKATVTFNKLGVYKTVEVTAKLIDGSTTSIALEIRPAILLKLSYPLEYSTGQYLVNQVAKLNVELTDLSNQQPILSAETFNCKFYKGAVEVFPDTKVCSPMEVSFVPTSTGSYRVWAKATYIGKDQYGNDIRYFPSEDTINVDVQLPQQDVKVYLGGVNIRSLDQTSEGAYKIETKSYTFTIKSSMNGQPYRLENCNIKMQDPDGSFTQLNFLEGKCRMGTDTECVYTVDYEFKQTGDTYSLSGSCEHNEDILTFDADFVTTEGKQVTSSLTPVIIGIIVGVVVIITIIVIIVVKKKRSSV